MVGAHESCRQTACHLICILSVFYHFSGGVIFFGGRPLSRGGAESIVPASSPLSMSICGGFGVIFLMIAYRQADPTVLAPFSYFGILTAFFFGWVLFGEFPVDKLFPGVILIIGSGLVILWREQRAKD